MRSSEIVLLFFGKEYNIKANDNETFRKLVEKTIPSNIEHKQIVILSGFLGYLVDSSKTVGEVVQEFKDHVFKVRVMNSVGK